MVIDVPEGLERVLMQCLAKDPTERPQDARELSRLLHDLNLEHGWSDERRTDWWNRYGPPPRKAKQQ